MAVARAGALAPRPVVLDHHVPELRGRAREAAVRLSVEDQSAADAGPERQEDQVAGAAPGPETPLGDRGRVRVVVDRDAHPPPALHPVAKVDVGERDVRREDGAPRRLVDRGRDGEPESPDAVVEQLLDRVVEAGQQVFLSKQVGVGRSCRRSTVPCRSTSPARIFVPPRSTPMTSSGADTRGG